MEIQRSRYPALPDVEVRGDARPLLPGRMIIPRTERPTQPTCLRAGVPGSMVRIRNGMTLHPKAEEAGSVDEVP
jgi:hypothetical protein